MLMAVCHSEATGWTEVRDLDRISELRAEAGNVLWAEADVANLSRADVETIAEEFDLHPLAVEDAIHIRQRPKLEPYESHLFIVLDELDEVEDQLEPSQVACFVGERYLLTIHDGANRVLNDAKSRWERAPTELPGHIGFLVYTLLDTVVDDYQTIADRLEGEIEELEDIILASPGAPIQRQLYGLKQQLSRLRRYALPLRRVLDWIVEGHSWPDMEARFRDVHDHILRINDQISNVEDLSQAALDLSMAAHNEALSQINKRLTAYAAIFAAAAVITGFYGMNFALLPDEQSLAGFWFAVGLIAATTSGLFVFFKRKDWL